MYEPIIITLASETWSAGDLLCGTVDVLQELNDCSELKVELVYGHCGSNWGKVTIADAILGKGAIPGGTSFPFEIQIPSNAPFTFKGQGYSIEWIVRATADVPLALDPKAELAFVLLPAVLERPDADEIDRFVGLSSTPKEKKKGKLAETLILILLSPFLILFLAIVIVLLPIPLFYFAKKKVVDTRLRDFTVDIPERPLLLGEWIPVTVRFRLKKAIDLVGLRICLRGTEDWRTASGVKGQSSSHSHNFHEQVNEKLTDTILAVAPNSRRGEFEYKTYVKLPTHGLPTLSSTDVHYDDVHYDLITTLDIRGWPDPTVGKRIKTLSAKVTEPQPPPEVESAPKLSPNIVFLNKGVSAPAGVDVSTADSSIWLWIILPTAGVVAMACGALDWILHPMFVTWAKPALVGGAVTVVVGLTGFFYKIYG